MLTNIPEPTRRGNSTRQGTRDLRLLHHQRPRDVGGARGRAQRQLSAGLRRRRHRRAPPETARRQALLGDRRRHGREPRTVSRSTSRSRTPSRPRELEQKLRPTSPSARPSTAARRLGTPLLHLVIADVSAVGGPYEEGFGLGPLQWAAASMGLALEAELLDDLRAATGCTSATLARARAADARPAPRGDRHPLDDAEQLRLPNPDKGGDPQRAHARRGPDAGQQPLHRSPRMPSRPSRGPGPGPARRTRREARWRRSAPGPPSPQALAARAGLVGADGRHTPPATAAPARRRSTPARIEAGRRRC